MKILIVTSFAGSWPYIPEMLEEFEKLGEHAEVFDIDDIGPMGLAAKAAFMVPKLRHPATIVLLKRRLALFPADFDGVNIHFAAPIYRDLAPALKRRGKKLITSIWGSDFLRAGPSALHDLGYTFDASDIVTTNNPEILRKIVAHYPWISNRIRIVPFGLRSLEVIAGLQRSESYEEICQKVGLPSDKVVVACGYNAIPEQRHAMIVEALGALSQKAKSRILALFPMTYPDTPAYRDEVRQLLESTNIEYRILEQKMTIEDICRVRIASDHVVNMQTTDSLSASLQEHLFAGSSMIVGKWLPYGVFADMGIPFQKVGSCQEISAALERAALEGKAARARPPYAERLYDYSSWSSNIGKWLDLFREQKTDEYTCQNTRCVNSA